MRLFYHTFAFCMDKKFSSLQVKSDIMVETIYNYSTKTMNLSHHCLYSSRDTCILNSVYLIFVS